MAEPSKTIAGDNQSVIAARIISDLANPLILPPLVLWITGGSTINILSTALAFIVWNLAG